jgi:hypothetical protein
VRDGQQEVPLPPFAGLQGGSELVERAGQLVGLGRRAPGQPDRAVPRGEPSGGGRGLTDRPGDEPGQQRTGQHPAEQTGQHGQPHPAEDAARGPGGHRPGEHDAAAVAGQRAAGDQHAPVVHHRPGVHQGAGRDLVDHAARQARPVGHTPADQVDGDVVLAQLTHDAFAGGGSFGGEQFDRQGALLDQFGAGLVVRRPDRDRQGDQGGDDDGDHGGGRGDADDLGGQGAERQHRQAGFGWWAGPADVASAL